MKYFASLTTFAAAPHRRAAVPALLMVLALAGCGGGGGGTDSNAQAQADADAMPQAMSSTAPSSDAAGASAPADATTDAAPFTEPPTAQPALVPPATAQARVARTTARPVGPATLALLVAAGDATSEAVALAYQRAHGIPDAHVVRVPVATDRDSLDVTTFTTLRQAVAVQLGNEVQATLVTWSRPSRVQGSTCTMGLTSALTFGYDTRWCGGCRRTADSPYYNSTTTRPWTDLQLRPSMMLGAATLADAEALIARGQATVGLIARRTAPVAGWLMRTNDATRSVRWPDFEQLATTTDPTNATASGVAWHYVDNSTSLTSNLVSNQTDLMFYLTGLAKVGQLQSNTYLPGAVADHLTSYGGLLPLANGQMPATDWLAAGLTGSYGTVEEPCNWQEKFPRASVLARHYRAGQTLIEAYWKSVRWPGQGLFVGDPLARPWAAQ